MIESRWVSTRKAADILGYQDPKSIVRIWRELGLTMRRPGERGHWRVRLDDVLEQEKTCHGEQSPESPESREVVT